MKVPRSLLALVPCLLVLLTPHVVKAYPQGPPLSVCASMYPEGHKTAAQTSTPPYELLVSSNKYSVGQNITVTLRMKDNHDPFYPYFEGVFVQARMAHCGSQQPVGTFNVPPGDSFLRTMDCHPDRPRSAVSQWDATHQTSKTFIWTAPKSQAGWIYFRATVVKNEKTFWTNVFSEFLDDNSASSQPPSDYCSVQKTVSSASSLAAVTSLIVVAFVTSLLFH